MTQELSDSIARLIGKEFLDCKPNTLRLIIEDHLDEAQVNTTGFIGVNLVETDIIISKEENNKLYELNQLYDKFMNEFEEELTLTN